MKTNSISENLINNNISDNNVNIFDNSDRLSKTGFSNESKNDNVNFTKDAAILTISNKDGFVRKKFLNSSKAYAPMRTSSSNVLKLGSKGDEVKKLQQDLTYLGYDTKGCDGKFGNNTRNAVIRFQADHKLTADGKVGPKTRSAITTAVNNKRNRTSSSDVLKLGSRGDKVAKLQNDLKTLGYYAQKSDGIFGENTKAAVISFQQKHGLTPDGMVGRKTNDAIQAALKNKPSQPTQPANPSVSSEIVTGLSENGFKLLASYEAGKVNKDTNGNIISIPILDIGDGKYTIGIGNTVDKSDSKTIEEYRQKYGIDVTQTNSPVDINICMKIYNNHVNYYTTIVNNLLKKYNRKVTQNEYDALVIAIYNRPALASPGHAIDTLFKNDNSNINDWRTNILNEYKGLSGWSKYGKGWSNRVEDELELYFNNDYIRNH